MSDEPWFAAVPMPVLLQAARAVYGGAIAEELRAEGFTDIPRGGARVLGGIAANGPLPARAASELGLPEQTVSGALDALHAAGHLQHASNVDGVTHELTDRGHRAAAAIRRAADRVEGELISGAGPDGEAAVRRLRQVLGGLVDKAHQH